MNIRKNLISKTMNNSNKFKHFLYMPKIKINFKLIKTHSMDNRASEYSLFNII